MILMLCALMCMVIFSACVGKYPITAGQSLEIIFRKIFGMAQTAGEMDVNVVIGLRMPRILASIFVGAALSVSGACYQGIFKNPLVSPDFLGVSSGACIGAAIAILLALPSMAINVFAFVGGIIVVCLTTLIPKAINNRSNIMLVLSGIIMGSLMSSILGFIKYTADPDTQLASITYWTMGSFQYVSKDVLLIGIGVLAVPFIILILMSWWIDVLSMGEDEARTLGANVSLVRGIAILCSTLLTAGSVCISGTIGWVGLIVPHFSRMIVGHTNKKLMPFSAIAGGMFMLLVDTLTRIVGQSEMPVSIMTGIIGAPVFCWLLFTNRRWHK